MSYFENNFTLVQVLEHRYPPYKKITTNKIMTNDLPVNSLVFPTCSSAVLIF